MLCQRESCDAFQDAYVTLTTLFAGDGNFERCLFSLALTAILMLPAKGGREIESVSETKIH